MPRDSRAPEYAGAAAAAALPTAAAIQRQLRLKKLKDLLEAAKEVSHKRLGRMARVGDVIMEGQPGNSWANSAIHGPATVAVGSPLTHAELVAPGRRMQSGGHQVDLQHYDARKNKWSDISSPDDLFSQLKHLRDRLRNARRRRGLSSSVPPSEILKEIQRMRREGLLRGSVRRGRGKSYVEIEVYKGRRPESLLKEQQKELRPSVLFRRASGKALNPEELASLTRFTSKAAPSVYGTSRVLGNVLKGFFMPEFLTRGAAPGCRVNPTGAQVCTSVAGGGLKQLGGLQEGRATHVLPSDIAVDPNLKIMGVSNKAALLKRLRESRLQSAGLHAGAVGLAGLGGYAAVRAFRKRKEDQQPVAKAKNWLAGLKDKAMGGMASLHDKVTGS